jgi:hypothetical protein
MSTTTSTITFTFDGTVPMDEVQFTLRLALLAVESLHGEDRVMLDTGSRIDHSARTCTIDTTSDTGRTLAVVFGGFARREFGNEAVSVRLINPFANGGGR